MDREEINKLAVEAKENIEAFSQLYDIFQPKVYAHAARWVGDSNEADDITARVFEKVLRGIRGFNPKKASFSTWLYTISNNVMSDYFRERGRIKELNHRVAEQYCTRESEVDIDRLHSYMTLHSLIRELPWKYQAVLILKFVEDLPDEDIARIVKIRKRNVAMAATRALRALREIATKRGVYKELEGVISDEEE